MAAELLPMLARAADTANSPYSGAQWYFYESGTSTPLAVYANATLVTSLGAVVTADSAGKFPAIYFDASQSYRGVLKNSTGSVTLFDIDPINAAGSWATQAELDAALAAITAAIAGIPAAIDDAVSDELGSNTSAVTPLYFDGFIAGLIPDHPDNVRTGLSATLATGGGYATELQIAVTGIAGSKLLSTSETTKVAGLGSDPWDGSLNSTDGDDDFFVTVRSNNGSTQITLDKALERDFTGTLSSRNADLNDQHITQGATRALAQAVAEETGFFGSRGATLDSEWYAETASATTTRWRTNAALRAYNLAATGSETTGVNSAAPIIQTVLGDWPAINYVQAKVAITANNLAGAALYVGTHASGHGVTRLVQLQGKAVGVEFWTGAARDTNQLTGTQITVTATQDGTVVYTAVVSDSLARHRIPCEKGGNTLSISVTNTDGGIYNILLSQFSAREAGAGGRLGGKKVVTMGDSWFAYYNGLFSTVLEARTGAEVVNHSLGGMTTEWALSWFDQYVRDEKPDVAVFHFYTNDSNDLSGTFVNPAGGNTALWDDTLTDSQSQARWKANILKLVARCLALGIKPVVMLPAGVDGIGQAQKHMQWRWNLDVPLSPKLNAQTGTTYTLAATDEGKVVELTNAGAIALTIPADHTVAWNPNAEVEIHQGGAGAVTVTAASGVTLVSRSSLVATNGQHAVVNLRKVGLNKWRLWGDRV